MPSDPSGPDREMSEYTSRPTTTVGSAIRVFSTASSGRRNRNRFSAISTPRGMPGTQAISVEDRPNRREVPVMNHTSLSPVTSSVIACASGPVMCPRYGIASGKNSCSPPSL